MIMSKNPHCSLALNIVYGTDLKFSILIRSILSRFLKCWICCPGGSVVKNPPANARDASSIPGSGRSPGEGNGIQGLEKGVLPSGVKVSHASGISCPWL